MDDFSSLQEPPRSTLHGRTERRCASSAKKKAKSDESEICPTEIVKVKAADGTPLYARMIKPVGFRAGEKYPAVVVVYGGPGVQQVRERVAGRDVGSGAGAKRFRRMAAG